jgi:hypothetical protein
MDNNEDESVCVQVSACLFAIVFDSVDCNILRLYLVSGI